MKDENEIIIEKQLPEEKIKSNIYGKLQKIKRKSGRNEWKRYNKCWWRKGIRKEKGEKDSQNLKNITFVSNLKVKFFWIFLGILIPENGLQITI